MKNKKRDKNEIKAILFDIGGVLALGNNSSWKNGKLVPSGVHLEVSEKVKMPLDSYLEAIETNFALAIEGRISETEVVNVLSQKLKVSDRELRKIFVNAYKRNFKQNINLLKKAFELKKLGYKIGILSDQWYLSKQALIPNKIYKKFDELIISCEVGFRKPSPEIFKIALKKLKLKPKEVLFIDNQTWNLKAARKLGIKTLIFIDNKQIFNEKNWSELFEK